MLVLSLPKKEKPRDAGKNRHLCFAIVAILAFFFPCGEVYAQAQTAIINPTGGTVSDNKLRIEIRDSCILVRRKGVDQYKIDPAQPQYDNGLRTYFILQQRFGEMYEKDPKYIKACEISDVYGDGTPANPWKIVTLSTFNNLNGATYNVSTVYTYVDNTSYYNIDFLISSNEGLLAGPVGAKTGGPYFVHIYLSQRSFMNSDNCSAGFSTGNENSVSGDIYHFEYGTSPSLNMKEIVGTKRTTADCGAGPEGVQLFKTKNGFTSWYAGPSGTRDLKVTPDYELSGNINNVPQSQGIAVHKAIYIDAKLGDINHNTKRFVVGFDSTELKGLTVMDPNLLSGNAFFPFAKATIELSSATPSGPEGDDTHVINNLTLKVSGAKFNLPQIATVKVIPTTTGINDAVEGTDYEVLYTKIIIPPGDYTYTPANFPLNNIMIKGDDDLDPDKTFRVKLTTDCSPHLQLGANNDVIYTIIDDDANELLIEPAQTTLEEGKTMKVKVRMSGTPLATDVVVTLAKGTADAESTDHSAIPATITILAGTLFTEFDFDAIADRILEPATESLDITATATISGLIRTHTATISIIDTTGLNPANKIITFTAPATIEGNMATVTASLPDGVTTELPIVIAITEDPSSTAYSGDFDDPIPADMTIGAYSNSTFFTLNVLADMEVEPMETLVINGVSAGFTINNGQLNIIQNAVALTVEFDNSPVTEGAYPIVWVRLPPSYYTTYDFDVTLQVDASSTVSALENDYYIPDLSDFKAHFYAFSSEASYDYLEIWRDNLMELQEKIVINGVAPGFTITPGTLLIDDYESAQPGNTEFFLEMVDGSIFEFTEGETVEMKITLAGGIPSSIPLVFTISTVNTDPNITADDYDLPLTVTLPAGETSVNFPVKANIDALIETDEELAVTADGNIFGHISNGGVQFIWIKDGVFPVIKFTTAATDYTEGASITITASLPSGVYAASDIEIAPERISGSAEDEDFDLPGGSTFIIPTGANSQTFTIEARTDDVLERLETLSLGGTSTGYIIDPVVFNILDATGAISANKDITLSPVTTSVLEGDNLTVWVRLPAGITTAEELSIDITAGSNTVASLLGTEYTLPAAGTVKIPANANGGTFILAANLDDVLEPDEQLEIVASSTVFDESKTAATLVNIKDLTGTIAANKVVTVSAPASVTEGGISDFTFTLKSGITTQEDMVIQLVPGLGTDASPADFEGGYPSTVTIPAGGFMGTLSVETKDDAIIELQEKLILIPSYLDYTFTRNVDLNIIDNDLVSATIVLSTAASVAEGGTATITATLQGGITSSTAINIVLTKDALSTAGSGDHGALGTITIPAGSTTGSVDITTTPDLILEDTESLILDGVASGFTITGTTVNITDATGTVANKQITLTPAAATVAEGGSIQVKVSLPTDIITSTDLIINLTRGTGTVSTLLATEYNFPSTVTILAGNNEETFTLAANTDLVIEPDEQLEIEATATIFGEAVSATTNVDITDVTTSKLITITGDITVTEGSSATITFSLPSGITTAEDLDINLAVAVTSTALPADFTGVFPTKVTIPAGGNQVDLVLSAKVDGIIEPLEQLELIPSAAGGFTFDKNVELDVVDNDLAGATIILSSVASVTEGDNAIITATLQGGLTAGSDMVITLSKGSGSTAANDEHNALTTITILAGESSGIFTLTTNTDDLLEPSESVVIEGTASGFTVIPVTINITDLNGQNSNNKIFTITPASASIAEGGTTSVKISLPSPHRTQDALTITLSRGALSSASLLSSEYSNFVGTIVIPAGGSEISFDLDAYTDNLIEPTEQLELVATAMVYGTSVTAKTTVDITDVTANKVIAITGATSVTEGNSATITFSLQDGAITAEDMDINLAVAGTSTALPADFTGVFPTKVTILAGDDHVDLVLSAKADGIIEPLERLELIPSAAGGFTFDKNVELDVVDNDLTGATIALSAAASVTEGSPVNIVATLQGGLISATDITVTLTKDVLSTAGSGDHGALGTITIPAGSTTGNVDITTTADLILENTESLILDGTAAGFTITGTTVNITDATGTVANKQITLTPAATTVAEGGSIQVKVSLPTDIITSTDLIINLTRGAGTVSTLLSSEYNFPSTVTILAGNNEETFTLAANTDQIIEPDEQLEIEATATIFGEAVSATTNVDITDVTTSKLITITGDITVTEGSSATITFSLPSGITTAEDLDINLAVAVTSTALPADFTGVFPTKVTIPAGGNHVDLVLSAKADGIIEALEQLELIPSAAGGFTFDKNVELDVVDNDLAGATIILSTAASVAEGGTATITATLQGGITSSSAINIVLTKDVLSTAGSGDHGALGTITITAGNTTGSVNITATADLILENTESLILNGTAAGFTITGTTVNITDATGTVANKQITLTPVATTVAEGGSVQVKVSLPTGIITSTDLIINLTRGAGTVSTLLATEYNLPSTVTILAGNNEETFTVAANTDLVIEPDEQLEIEATATIFGEAVSATTNVTVTDATPSRLITVAGPVSVSEGNSAVFTFSLPSGYSTAEALEINLTQGTVTPAVDAADLNGGIPDKVIIPAGGHDVTLTIQANADGVIEVVEKLQLIPSAAGGFTFSQDVLLDILDESHSGTITFTSNTSGILEANGTATITVSLPGVLIAGSDIQVNIIKSGSSTASNTDHSTLPSFVTIPNGEHETTFTVTAPLDLILEGIESLVLDGSALGYGVSGTTIQILDSTHLDPLNTIISLNPNGASIAEGTTGHFFVSLPGGVVSTTPIVVQLAKIGATSTAADTDHTQIPVSITIPALANASANFDISAVVDGIIEPTESIKVDGVVPAGFTFAGASIDITDVTGLTLANRQIFITIDSTTLHEGNTSKVTFALPNNITTAEDIIITVNPDGGFSATAADFTLTPNTVIIPKDGDKVTVILEALADNIDEPDEQLRLTGTATGFTVIASGTLTIPGSGAPAITVTAVKTTDAAEPSTPGMFVIKLPGSAIAPADITVNYTVAGTAVPNEDYEPLTGIAIIKAGENSVNVPVIVKDDYIIEGDETVELTLQSASFVYFGNTVAASVDNTGGAGMLILDDESIAEGRKILIENVTHAAEPATNGIVRVRFSDAQFTATVPITVTYTVAGTATPGVDYNTLSGTVIIPAGSNSAIITIVPIDDLIEEARETIIIQLTGASAGIPLSAQQTATVDLYDNDTPPALTVEVFAPASVAEGTVIPVTVRASQNTPVDMPVTLSLLHDAFRTVSTSATFTITIPANQKEATINVTLVDNDNNDDNGFVNLAIQPFAGVGQPYGIGTIATAATTVTDNDPLEISFKVDTARVKEGNSGITPLGFTVKLSRMSSRVINLNYQFTDTFEGQGADKDPMRARAGEDFQPHITSLAIAPMQLEAEIVVPVIGDLDAELDEYFNVRLTTATVVSGENAPTIVTPRIAVGQIQNDDKPIEMEIKVNKGLSPNGDGKNDVLFIENLEKYTQNEIVIVNRWGGTVYKTSNYNNQSNNFSGRANTGGGSGSNLPDGSYFYVLHTWDINGNMTRHTGYIVLKR